MTCSNGATLDVASAEIAQSAYATDSDQEPKVSIRSRKNYLPKGELRHFLSWLI